MRCTFCTRKDNSAQNRVCQRTKTVNKVVLGWTRGAQSWIHRQQSFPANDLSDLNWGQSFRGKMLVVCTFVCLACCLTLPSHVVGCLSVVTLNEFLQNTFGLLSKSWNVIWCSHAVSFCSVLFGVRQICLIHTSSFKQLCFAQTIWSWRWVG